MSALAHNLYQRELGYGDNLRHRFRFASPVQLDVFGALL